MKHSVPHFVGKEKAKKAARAACSAYSARFTEFDAKANWVSEDRAEISFSVKGMKLSGKIAVHEQQIDVEMDVPFLLRPFQKVAMTKIEEEMTKWLGKAAQGAFD